MMSAKEKKAEYMKVYYAANKEKKAEYMKVYWAANKEKKAEYMKVYYAANKEKVAAAQKAWGLANPDKVAAKCAERRASKLKATPAWADKEAIKSWYTLSKMFNKTFGEPHHVDHIVPLQGKNICGLHVEYNLQILTATENFSKGNRL